MTNTKKLQFICIDNDENDQTYRVLSSIASSDGWPIGSGWGDFGEDEDRLVFHDAHFYPMAPNTEDAKRIVHCWNCHDELLEALEEMVNKFFSLGYGDKEDYKKAKSAIAKARGK